MADNYITMDQLDMLFADYVQEVLRLQDYQVMLQYNETGIKSSKMEENVIYLKTHKIQDDVEANKLRVYRYNNQTGNQDVEQTTMSSFMVSFVGYGPKVVYMLTKLNDIFYQDSSKQFFYKNNIALVPSRTEFVTNVHEKINERFWQRSDLKVYFYTSYTFGTEVKTISSANINIEPGIIIS